MLVFAHGAFQQHTEYICRLETGLVAIASAQESIWSFDSSWPSAADVFVRGCRKLEFYAKNNCKVLAKFWRFSTHFVNYILQELYHYESHLRSRCK